MTKTTVNKLVLLFLICIILVPIINPLIFSDKDRNFFIKNNGSYISKANNNEKELKFSANTFQLTEEFTPSSYYISPSSSPNYKDDLFFSFEANRNGNYSIEIKNFARILTENSRKEQYLSFDNPTYTDLYYLSYISFGFDDYRSIEIKMEKSTNKGKNWESKVVANIQPQVTTSKGYYYYLGGTAIAANPSKGVIGIITYLNRSKLVYFGSKDNGTTWNGPYEIANINEIGCQGQIKIGGFPNIELGILPNGTIYALTETLNNTLNSIVFFKSNDNGTHWDGPFNITCLEGLECYNARLQIDLNSGDFWLICRVEGMQNNASWAEFNSSSSLSDNVQLKTITDVTWGLSSYDFDFYYDSDAQIFRFIEIKDDEVINFTTNDFASDWISTSLGNIPELTDSFSGYQSRYKDLNIVYDGDTYQFFFYEDFLGRIDVYQYIYLENPLFWSTNGSFNAGEFCRVYWNGTISNPPKIDLTHVKVEFIAKNGTGPPPIERLIYIWIDNQPPNFENFLQKLNYFNPKASNINFSEVLWDILPSEPCQLNLEIYGKSLFNSEQIQLTYNNLEDFSERKKIFYSNTGQLYALYYSYRAGGYYINLMRSLDYGATWSNPIEIYRSEQSSYPGELIFNGAAWGDIIVISIQSIEGNFFYISLDQGNIWQEPINMDDINSFPFNMREIFDLVFTSNGTLYLATIQHAYLGPSRYLIFESIDLGLNWKLSANWSYSTDSGFIYDDISFAYDYVNELLYFMNTEINFTYVNPVFANITFLTLNLTEKTWSNRNNVLVSLSAPYPNIYPNLLVTRKNSSSPVVLRAVFVQNMEFDKGILKYKRYELNSTDGKNWNGPYKSSINDTPFLAYKSVLDNNMIYYLSTINDGFDNEIVFEREGYLIKSKKVNVTPLNVTEFTFDGKDDFGNYIDEGNYTYKISLKDPADNIVEVNGWLYADYNAPQITDYSTNWVVPPVPRYDTTVTAKIMDGINFTAYLYYRKDNGDWQKVRMNFIGNEKYSATILGDSFTSKIEYYIMAIDLAGNERIFDNNGDYFICDMPEYIWDSEGLFKEDKSYSSSDSYEISVTILNDLEYVREVLFRYSYDEGDEWDDLELEQSSPEFEGKLDDLPEDLRELHYKIIIVDIFGNEIELIDTQKVEFYPEVPSLEVNLIGMVIAGTISAILGILLAIAYIKLKKSSHKTMHKQIFYQKYKQSAEIPEDVERMALIKKSKAPEVTDAEDIKIATGFTHTYLGILFSTIAMLLVGILISGILSLIAVYLIAGSLTLTVLGYMILMNRDITLNIYLERIHKKNIFFESIQILLMFIIIIALLLVGDTIPWFRYYLIESTLEIATLSIPTLFFSLISVFFTSLVLVIISTYLQLKKTFKNIRQQRKQGQTENFILFAKDQSLSKLTSQLALKTIIFLVVVLFSVITTTNLITYDTGIVLSVVAISFIIACASVIFFYYVIVKKKSKTQKKDIEVPFIDRERICLKCGESIFQSDKFCSACGAQLILPEKFGIFIARCKECDAHIPENAKHCPSCGVKV